MVTVLDGVAAGGGIAIAPVYRLGESRFTVKAKYTDNVNHEVSRLHDSFSLARRELTDLRRQAHQKMGEKAATVIDAQLAIAKDQSFEGEITDAIQRYSTTAAWTATQRIDHYLNVFKRQSGGADYYHARGLALQDFKKRLLAHLLDEELPDLAKLDHRAIIVAHQLTPTDIIRLNPHLVAGIVTDLGGRTAHFLVMSKEMRFPTVVDTKTVTEHADDDMVAIIDGTHGRVILQPTPQQIDQYQRLASRESARLRELGVLKHQDTVSADGHHFEVAANVALPRESDELATSGAEGSVSFVVNFFSYTKTPYRTKKPSFRPTGSCSWLPTTTGWWCARSTSAAISNSPRCPWNGRTTPSWACAACGLAWPTRGYFGPSCGRSCGPRRTAS